MSLTDTNGTQTYSYDAANYLTYGDGIIYTVDAKLSTDERGNLIHTGVFTYTYDGANHMVRAESVTTTAVYTYNVDGLRVQDAQRRYVWDWAAAVPELLHAGETTYLVGYDTLGWDNDGVWTYVLPDALGSTRQVVDASGTVLDARAWSPYGVELGSAQGGLGYTGEWWDAATGLLYLRARWYDAQTSRFLSPDTIVPDFINPQSLNHYCYVLNSPVNYVDPTGHDPLDPDWEREFEATMKHSVTDLDRQRRLYEIAYPGPVSERWPWTAYDRAYFVRNQDLVYRSTSHRKNLDDFVAAIERLVAWYENGEEAEFVSGLALLYAGWPYDPSGRNIWLMLGGFRSIDVCGGFANCGSEEYHVNHDMNGFVNACYHDDEENTHHYVGHLLLAFHWGGVTNLGITPLREYMQNDADRDADIYMGWVAGGHGYGLWWGRETEGLVGVTVKDFPELLRRLEYRSFPF